LPLTPIAPITFPPATIGMPPCKGVAPASASAATRADLVLEVFTRPAKDGGGPGFADSDFHAGHLCVIEAMQDEQVSTVIHDANHHGGASSDRFRFGRRGDLLRRVQRQHPLDRKLGLKAHDAPCQP